MAQSTSRGRYLLKNTAIFAIGNFATKLISFFLVPLYTNALTTEQYGTADLVTTVCTVLAPVLILNLGDGVMRFALDKDADYDRIMSIGLVAFAGAIVVGLLILPAAERVGQLSAYAADVYFYTITIAGSQLFLCYLRGREKLVAYSVGNIVQSASIALLNILFLLVLDRGLSGYFLAYIVASAATMVYAFLAGGVWRVFRNFSLDFALAQEMVAYSVVLIPNTFMWWIINSSDRVLVNAMLGAAANGVYAVSYKIPSIVSVVAGIFNQAWGYSAIHEEESEDRDQYANAVYRGLVAISLVTGVGLMLVMKPLMAVYVEASYYEAWVYTPFLVIGNVFATTGSFLAAWYTVNKDSKGYLLSATCGAVANVILNLLLIPVLGVAGSALATCVSLIAVFVYRAVDTRRYIKINAIDPRQVVAYAILALSGATIFVDGILGEALMFVELVAVTVLFKDVWSSLVRKLAQCSGR